MTSKDFEKKAAQKFLKLTSQGFELLKNKKEDSEELPEFLSDLVDAIDYLEDFKNELPARYTYEFFDMLDNFQKVYEDDIEEALAEYSLPQRELCEKNIRKTHKEIWLDSFTQNKQVCTYFTLVYKKMGFVGLIRMREFDSSGELPAFGLDSSRPISNCIIKSRDVAKHYLLHRWLAGMEINQAKAKIDEALNKKRIWWNTSAISHFEDPRGESFSFAFSLLFYTCALRGLVEEKIITVSNKDNNNLSSNEILLPKNIICSGAFIENIPDYDSCNKFRDPAIRSKMVGLLPYKLKAILMINKNTPQKLFSKFVIPEIPQKQLQELLDCQEALGEFIEIVQVKDFQQLAEEVIFPSYKINKNLNISPSDKIIPQDITIEKFGEKSRNRPLFFLLIARLFAKNFSFMKTQFATKLAIQHKIVFEKIILVVPFIILFLFIGQREQEEQENQVKGKDEKPSTVFKRKIKTGLDGFKHFGIKTYSCGERTYKVREFIHERTGLVFSFIPGGYFTMGSNFGSSHPSHRVFLDDFLISQTEVTQEVWEKIMGDNPAKFKDKKRPVSQITWAKAKEFCQATELDLPTEAQWEYACRAGTTGKYYWENSKDVSTYAWYDKNTKLANNKPAQPVEQKKPNAFGLHDMSGNVFEFCEDYFGSYNSTFKSNPTGPKKGQYRVSRGGSWTKKKTMLKSAYRHPIHPSYPYNDLGFRVVRNIK